LRGSANPDEKSRQKAEENSISEMRSISPHNTVFILSGNQYIKSENKEDRRQNPEGTAGYFHLLNSEIIPPVFLHLTWLWRQWLE
jgi:hypothetical protein